MTALVGALACAVPDGPTALVPTVPSKTAEESVRSAPESALNEPLSDAMALASDPLLARIVAALSDQTRPRITSALAAVRADLARQDVVSVGTALSQLHRDAQFAATPADMPLLTTLDLYIAGVERTISLQKLEK